MGLLFCNTYEVATDLLEKQGAIYSDKPALVMAGDLCVSYSCSGLSGAEHAVCETDVDVRTWLPSRGMGTSLAASAGS